MSLLSHIGWFWTGTRYFAFTNNRNDLPHLLILVIILIIPLSFRIFNCSRYESLLISIVPLLVFVHCTNLGNNILPLNYFYFHSHYYFLCICTFLCWWQYTGQFRGRQINQYFDNLEVNNILLSVCKFCSNGTPILKSAVHSFWFSGTRFLLKTVRFSFIIVM